MTIRDAARRIAAGQASALELTRDALARIAARPQFGGALEHLSRPRPPV
jgi:hypothetical protein